MGRRLWLIWLGLAAIVGCDAQIGGAPPPPPPGDSDAGLADAGAVDGGATADAGPTPCLPTANAVPKLLRLSNHEYRNMVSDLLGAPVDEALFARWTPVAEVYGFDTMSETRVDQQALEEQLTTAEALAKIILGTPAMTAHCPAVRAEETPSCTLKPTYSARDDFSDTQSRECWTYLDTGGTLMIFDNGRGLWRKDPDETALLWRDGAHPGSSVDVLRRWESPVTGTATISGSFADADPGGGDGVMVTILHNGAPIFTQDLANGGSTNFNLRRSLARGDHLDFVVGKKADPSYDTTAFSASIELLPTPRKAAWTWDNCAAPLISRLASRAFRRPVRPEELEDYRAQYEAQVHDAAAAGFLEPVDMALEASVESVLLSPNFVFKPELVPGGVDPSEHGFAIASRLSLFLRSSLPDDELWTLAGSGGLNSPAAIRAQAERLLGQDAQRFATSFGGQWLAYRDLGMHPLAESMRTESRQVFQAVLSEGLTPDRLLYPGFTFVDAPLASFYGITDPPGRVNTTLRGGILAQGAFLSRTGEGSEFRRPIHRGLWVLTRLLCRTLPRLDPATREEINMSFGHIDPTLPLPARMKLHRDSSTRCGSCHSHIDPIGLALEKFDPQGLWRTTYADGTPIVSDLELNGTLVRDPYELAQALGVDQEFRTCVSTKLLTFALNRGPLDSERCVIDRLAEPTPGARPSLQTLAVDALLKGMELTEVQP
ncbi:MAG: DUF1588 domain-containing protein [Myxococcota bacterium]